MHLYKIDLKVCATAYIKASSSGEAMEKAHKLTMDSVAIADVGGVPISSGVFDDPNLPDVSISPAMTIHGIWNDFEEKEATMDLVEMDLPEPA